MLHVYVYNINDVMCVCLQIFICYVCMLCVYVMCMYKYSYDVTGRYCWQCMAAYLPFSERGLVSKTMEHCALPVTITTYVCVCGVSICGEMCVEICVCVWRYVCYVYVWRYVCYVYVCV